MLIPEPVMAPGFIVHFPVGKPVSSMLPVATLHVGCVIVLIAGAVAVGGWVLIITLVDGSETHPEFFVTV